MHPQHHFETPEDVDLGFTLAGPPARFGAYVIDFLWLLLIRGIIVMAGIGIVVNFNLVALQEEDFIDNVDGWVITLILILFYFSEFLYFGYFEWRRNGSTPGKKVSGLRAVMDGGYRLTPTAAWLRNLLRPIDVIPLLWLVPLVDNKNRRLGDFLAGTVVVTEIAQAVPKMPLAKHSYGSLTVRHLNLSRSQLMNLRRRDYVALEEYLVRYKGVPKAKLGRLQRLLLAPLLTRLDTEIPSGVRSGEVLAEIYLAMRDSPGLLDQVED
jgi:uncharacterized RDD family membrane protein YckC